MDKGIEKHDVTKPGNKPSWSSGAKTMVGTAASVQSQIWYTVANGTLNEIYFPDVLGWIKGEGLDKAGREEHGYNPPKREWILEWQAEQEFPILPNPQDPDCGNLYRRLKFPDAVYEHIEEQGHDFELLSKPVHPADLLAKLSN